MFNKIARISAALMFMVALPFAASAATLGPLTINQSGVTQGQSLNLSGTCATNSANGNVNVGLVNTPSTQNATVVTDANGNFTTSFAVPQNFTTGTSIFTATCPNGDILTGNISVNSPLGSSIGLNTNMPTLGQNLTVSGSCGTTAQGGNVNLNFVRTIGTTALGTTTTTNGSGSFNGNFTVPSNAGGGPVMLVATCPNGTVTINTGITDPNANVSLGSSRVVAGTALPVSGFCNTTAGGNVNFILSNPAQQVNLGTAALGSTGSFSSNVTVPAGFVTGNSTLVMFCPTGNIVSASVVVDPNTGSTGTTGIVAGTTTTTGTTPVGGVAAGTGVDFITIVALLLVIAGAAGLVSFRPQVNNYAGDEKN